MYMMRTLGYACSHNAIITNKQVLLANSVTKYISETINYSNMLLILEVLMALLYVDREIVS